LRAGVEAPVRAHVQRRAAVRDRQRLHRALDAARVAPGLRPARYIRFIQLRLRCRVSDRLQNKAWTDVQRPIEFLLL
jgi:hypothetical protein